MDFENVNYEPLADAQLPKTDSEASAVDLTFAAVPPELLRCILPRVQAVQDGMQAKSDLAALAIALIKVLGLRGVAFMPETAAPSDTTAATETSTKPQTEPE